MCRADKGSSGGGGGGGGGGGAITGCLACLTVSFMASTIALAVVYAQEKDKNQQAGISSVESAPAGGDSGGTDSGGGVDSVFESVPGQEGVFLANGYGVPLRSPPPGNNPCAGKKPDEVEYFNNVDCLKDGVLQSLEQAGADVTVGYKGQLNATGRTPITTPYFEAGLCPVNVHWHLGAEHRSEGEFDELGSGPYRRRRSDRKLSPERLAKEGEGRTLAGNARLGFQCRYYDEADPKFTTYYEWQHCVDMEVGQTYEVHWPHSAAGACGTLNQYQTPFYDGVFCVDGILSLDPLNTFMKIGVQSQVFTIVNDEDYYYPDLMRGMIVDPPKEMGTQITKYTGSTTGTSRDNTVCSRYTPITWQVDRKCHLVSASSFDKMCADMKAQRDDMSDDLYAHGSRELVADYIAADNHQNVRKRRGLGKE